MTRYARVEDGTATRITKPGATRRLDNNAWVMNLIDADEATRNACGIYSYEPAERPTVTASQVAVHLGPVYDARTDTVTDTWQIRDKTQDELDADATEATRDARRQAIANALTRLGQIEAGAESATNAQLKTAIGDIAGFLDKLIRDLYRDD